MINHTLQSINPKNHIAINSWNVHSKEEVDAIINNAVKAQLSWGDLNLNARINNVNELAHIIDDKKKELSIIMADEMGKPIKQGVAEIAKCRFSSRCSLNNPSISCLCAARAEKAKLSFLCT